MKIKINVTREIIDDSLQMCKEVSSMENCMVALAIRRAIGIKTSVSTACIVFFEIPTPYGPPIIKTPSECSLRIPLFDNIILRTSNFRDYPYSILPFSFELKIPDEVINYIGIEEIIKILTEKQIEFC